MIAADAGLGFSRFVSIGNQADVQVAELIGNLADHPGTELIAISTSRTCPRGRRVRRRGDGARPSGEVLVVDGDQLRSRMVGEVAISSRTWTSAWLPIDTKRENPSPRRPRSSRTRAELPLWRSGDGPAGGRRDELELGARVEHAEQLGPSSTTPASRARAASARSRARRSPSPSPAV